MNHKQSRRFSLIVTAGIVFELFFTEGLEHLGNTTLLLFHIGVNVEIESSRDVRVSYEYTDSFVVAVTLNATGCK